MHALIERLDSCGIPAALLAADRRFVCANALFSDIVGRSPAVLAGLSVDDIWSSTGEPAPQRLSRRARRVACAGRTACWRLDETPCDGGTLARLTDISAEFATFEALTDFYATRDRLLFDGKIGTWRFDPDAEMFFFSSELALGHSEAAEPVPVALLERVQHRDDRKTDAAIRDKITREGGQAHAEIRYREADGSWTHLDVHYRAGRRLPSGRYEILGISQNITAVASARDEANAASQRLALALKAAHAGVFEYDFVKRETSLSQELMDLLGSDAAGRVAQKPLSLFMDGDIATVRAVLDRARSTGLTETADVVAVIDGRARWVRVDFTVVGRDAEGRPLRGVGLLIDVDGRKRQEIALTEAQRAAEFANRTKTEFLANMSHELRTPLNAILGFSEVIQSQLFGPVNPKYADYAHDIHRSGEHLLELVNDVLDLAKLEAGKLELREVRVSLPEIVSDCLSLVQAKAEAGEVGLQCEVAPLAVRADPRAVKQILLNFLSNAVKFTPPGGTVRVTAASSPAGEVTVSVSDTGIGMTEPEIRVALSPFGQIDSKLARKHQGTGLGLPICVSLMELHGGDLTVTSRRNEGTTLTARFPAERTIGADARLSA